MGWTATKFLIAGLAAIGAAGSGAAQSSNATPTCSDVLDIDVHGQHVIGDYVTGIGHEDLEWSPSGGTVGEAAGGNRGVAIEGGPGPGFHFENGFAPGASFCTDSQSPGWPHL
jgi:hypothetical protein